MSEKEASTEKMYSKKEALPLELELQRLFGETSYHVERTPCRGKYRGHSDYSIVFGSGRTLPVGLDQRNYLKGLQEQLSYIRNFRAHQAENTAKVNAILQEHDTPFCNAEVGIVPCHGDRNLILYAVIILTHKSGVQFVYRETGLHYLLVSEGKSWRTLDECMAHLLKDSCGEMNYTKVFEAEKPIPKQPKRAPSRKGGLSR